MLRSVSNGLWVVGLLALVGCGSESDEQREDGIAIPRACRGFAMEGLRYSPGGSTLPNTCEPFHPRLNNPYAVRCVDVLPAFKTPYAGDDYCILPPAPEQGMQVGVHPQGPNYWEQIWAGDMSGYLDPELTAPFELASGAETEQLYTVTTPNDAFRDYYRVNSRMRTGSHHMASFFTANALEEGWQSEPPTPGGIILDGNTDPREGAAKGAFFNVQRSDTDRPQGALEIAEEDRGIGMPIAPHQGIRFDLHHFNTTPAAILREAWINVWWTTDVRQRGQEFAGVAPVNVAPGEIKDLSNTLTAKGETRLLSLFGHRHAWTPWVKAWIERVDGTTETIYQSVDWLDVPTYAFDSVTSNPEPRPSQDGGASGILTFREGDKLHFTCHVEATAERAAIVKAPLPRAPLVFGNHAFTAEMCIIYGYLIGPGFEGGYALN